MNIQQLPRRFNGKGEVKDFSFKRVHHDNDFIAYEVIGNGKERHFELFKRKLSPVCIDFENRTYSETDFKERYPKSTAFGKWAWTLPTIKSVMLKIADVKSKSKDDG